MMLKIERIFAIFGGVRKRDFNPSAKMFAIRHSTSQIG